MSTSIAIQRQRSTMNVVIWTALLWTAQVLSGIFWCVTGFGKVLCYQPALWNHVIHQVAWFSAVPQGLFVFIGVCETLGGIGLVLPAMTGVKPKLTPYAAFALTLVMILAALFHIVRRESNFLIFNLEVGAVAAFIGYGRWFVRPIAPVSPGAFRVLSALAVLGALLLVGYAPVWYTMPHTH